jgi:hypothetical protein
MKAGRRIREEASMGDSSVERTVAARPVQAEGEPVTA